MFIFGQNPRGHFFFVPLWLAISNLNSLTEASSWKHMLIAHLEVEASTNPFQMRLALGFPLLQYNSMKCESQVQGMQCPSSRAMSPSKQTLKNKTHPSPPWNKGTQNLQTLAWWESERFLLFCGGRPRRPSVRMRFPKSMQCHLGTWFSSWITLSRPSRCSPRRSGCKQRSLNYWVLLG